MNTCRPTSEFPHPLSRVRQPVAYRVSTVLFMDTACISGNTSVFCFFLVLGSSFPFIYLQLSYQVVDALIWLGIRDLINEFRKKELKLRRISYLNASYSSPLDIPYGYLWSPHLVPKPKGEKFSFLYFILVCFNDLLRTSKLSVPLCFLSINLFRINYFKSLWDSLLQV